MRKLPIGERIPELADQYAQERKAQPGFSDLEFLGAGGEQAVFAVAQKEGREGRYRNLVVKADIPHLRTGILHKILEQTDHLNPGLASRLEDMREWIISIEDERKQMKDQVEREQDFYRVLKQAFPPETILTSRASIRTVPLTPGVVREILEDLELEDATPQDSIEVTTIVRYQEPIPEEAKNKKEGGESSNVHSLGFRYAERYNIPSEAYQRLNQMIHDTHQEIDMELLSMFLHSGTVKLIEQSKTDAELAQVLRELIKKIIRFTNEFSQMLDLAGNGNVRVYRNHDDKWAYLFLDPYAGNKWKGAQVTARHVLSGTRDIDGLGANNLLNAINYERTVNAVARLLGIRERLTLHQLSNREAEESFRRYLPLLQSKHHWPDRFISEFRPKGHGSVEETVELPKK